MACLVLNLILLGGLVACWKKLRARWILGTCLALCLVAQCWLVRWMAVQGIRQLSQPIHEAFQLPPLATIVVVTTMIVVAVGTIAWRLLASNDQAIPVVQIASRPLYFHEQWMSGLLIGLVATTWLIHGFVLYPSEWPTMWEMLASYLTNESTQFLWVAAAIGGLCLAWIGWRQRRQPVDHALPSVNPALFAVTLASLAILIVTGAPILALVSFSYWLTL